MDWQTLTRELDHAQLTGSEPPDNYWEQFQTLALQSPQAEALAGLLRRGSTVPPSVRLMMVSTVARLLAPWAWPAAWDAARMPLIDSIREILHESDVHRAESLRVVLGLAEDDDCTSWVLVLRGALKLLEEPCQPGELSTVASLCRQATAGCLRIYRNKLSAMEPSDRVRVRSSRMQFELAYRAYANAARDMNAAIGTVMFLPLQRPFGDD